jgi:hypothetical protein
VAPRAAAKEAMGTPFQKPNRAPPTTVMRAAMGRKRVMRI